MLHLLSSLTLTTASLAHSLQADPLLTLANNGLHTTEIHAATLNLTLLPTLHCDTAAALSGLSGLNGLSLKLNSLLELDGLHLEGIRLDLNETHLA